MGDNNFISEAQAFQELSGSTHIPFPDQLGHICLGLMHKDDILKINDM